MSARTGEANAMASSRPVLVFNCGSSSLKFGLFELPDEPVSMAHGTVSDFGTQATLDWTCRGQQRREPLAARDHVQAAQAVLGLLARHDLLAGISAVGHRVVHGGEHFSAPVRVTDAVLGRLDSLNGLAPLHNPSALAVIRECRGRLGEVPAVAVFDTAFFHALPEHVMAYALPAEWRREFGIRRYGFHGIAHRYLDQRGRAVSGAGRVVTLQLGHGCSIAAIQDGRPVETSMGFTPLEGLVMATRPGDVDPGVLLHLGGQGWSTARLETALNHHSGLLGLSGASADMRELLALEAQGHAGAGLAITAFCHRARKYLGAYIAVLGGVEAIVFGGGIGEHAPSIRQRICANMAWCGIQIDAAANAAVGGVEARISTTDAGVGVWVVPVNEELQIARELRACLAAQTEIQP